MFTIKQPDSFALQTAEFIKRISEDMESSLAKSLVAGFKGLFYDNGVVRPKDDVRRILAAFDRPADLFKHHELAVTFLLTISPSIIAPEDYTPPFTCITNDADGTVTIPD